MSQLTDQEINRLRQMIEIDDIKRTKLLYSHLMDTGRIDDLAEIFTEDAICEFGPYGTWEGRETIRENYHKVETDVLPFGAMHGTCDHLVELTGPDSATGRSYLFEPATSKADGANRLGKGADENPFLYLGVYDEDYRKVEGKWLVSRCTLHFLWPERLLTGDFPGEFPKHGIGELGQQN